MRWSVAAVLMIAAIAALQPERLFDLPRERPLLWILVAVFYPLAASVEHALYGVLAFTVGLGDLFYHGAAGR